MKLTRQSILTAGALLVGGFIGASALVAVAANTWTQAPSSPPDNNVPAPINVGSGTFNFGSLLNGNGQEKTNNFAVDGYLFAPNLVVPAATTPGQVLVASGTNGAVAWGSSAGGSSVTSGGDATTGYWYQIGNLLIEGGISYPGSATNVTVTFPKPFSVVASIQVNPLQKTGGVPDMTQQVHPEQQVISREVSTTQFMYKTINNNGVSWLVIGTAQ